MNMTDWDNLGRALERQHLHTKIRLVKFMHNCLNTGYQKKKIDETAANECPVCLTTEETWMHLFQCQHVDAIAIRMLTITMFKSGLLKLETASIIKQVLCYKIAQCCKMLPLPTLFIADNDIGDVVQSAVEDQHQIGWNNFMKGKISIKWKAAQTMYTDALPASINSKEFNKDSWCSRV
eukprot:181426-Ditylum_brightwellii.AAC.1